MARAGLEEAPASFLESRTPSGPRPPAAGVLQSPILSSAISAGPRTAWSLPRVSAEPLARSSGATTAGGSRPVRERDLPLALASEIFAGLRRRSRRRATAQSTSLERWGRSAGLDV